MVQIDLSPLSYFIPLLGFWLVFVVLFAVLKKTKVVGDENAVMLIVSFIVAVIFVSATSWRQVVENVIPWFVLFLIALFFVMVLMAFSQGDINKMMKPWFGWVFVALLLLVFLISLMKTYSYVIGPYLPGSSGQGGDPFLLQLRDFFYSSRVVGAVLLLVLAAITARVLTSSKK